MRILKSLFYQFGALLALCFNTTHAYTWVTSNAINTNWRCISMSESGNYMAAGNQAGYVYISSDSGSSWTQAAYLNSVVTGISMSTSGQTIYAVSYSYGIYKSSNYGQTWALVFSQPNFIDVTMSSSTQFVYVCGNSEAYYSSNYGAFWTQSTGFAAGTSVSCFDMAVDSTGQYPLVASTSAGLYRSTNFGQTYSSTGLFCSYVASVACSSSGQYIVASCNNGALYYSANYGSSSSWIATADGTLNIQTYSQQNIAMDGSGKYVIVTGYAENAVYISTNYGMSTWTQTAPTATTSGYKFPGISSNAQIAAVVDYGAGIYWTIVNTAASANPSLRPTLSPSRNPTAKPTTPTAAPTRTPTTPTAKPSPRPSRQPTGQPSSSPSSDPSASPSRSPSSQPTSNPTQPTTSPSSQPSKSPTTQPSSQPSSQPFAAPTMQPTSQPTSNPTNPTSQPTGSPSAQPTSAPTDTPRCPLGYYYAFTPGGFQCYACAAGEYGPSASTLSCDICTAGSFSLAASSSCTLCPANSYISTDGATKCKSCPAGTISGQLGSTSAQNCVSPAVNFAIGGVCLFASVIAMSLYICCGRLKRVAFQRREHLVLKTMWMSSMTASMVKATIRGCGYVTEMRGEAKRERDKDNPCLMWIKLYGKPILFACAAALVIFVVMAFVLFYGLLQIVFNAMILYRGYRLLLPEALTLYDTLESLFEGIAVSLQTNIISDIMYPFLYAFNAVADININFSSVKIDCPGSQAPVQLLVDCLVVGVVVLVIESELQILWSTTLREVQSRFKKLAFNRYYLTHEKLKVAYYLLWSLLLSVLPPPRKWIQYALGWVAVSLFFARAGQGSRSENCDSVTGFPMDSALSALSSVTAYLLMLPLIYMFSQILVPFFNIRALKAVREKATITNADGSKKEIEVQISIDNSEVEDAPRTTEYFSVKKSTGMQKCLYNTLKLMFMLLALDWFYVKFVFIYAHQLFDNCKDLLADLQQPATYKKVEEIVQHQDKSKTLSYSQQKFQEGLVTHIGKHPLSEPPKLPWFFIWNKVFSDDDTLQEEIARENEAWEKKVHEFPTYYRMVCKVYEEFRISKRPWVRYPAPLTCWIILPQLFTNTGNLYWSQVFYNYCTFTIVTMGIWTDFAVNNFNVVHNYEELKDYLSYRIWTGTATPSTTGTSSNSNSSKSPDRKTTENPLRAPSSPDISKLPRNHSPKPTAASTSDTDEESSKDDTRSRAGSTNSTSSGRSNSVKSILVKSRKEDEEQLGRSEFQQYVSAVVSTRVTLIQIIPALTVVSIFAVDISSNPICVFSEEMSSRLNKLLVLDAYTLAKNRLISEKDEREVERQSLSAATADDNNGGCIQSSCQLVTNWKVCFLAVNIFFEESRLVQFCLAVYYNITAVMTVFQGITGLVQNAGLLVGVLLVVGFVKSLNLIILLDELIFPIGVQIEVDDAIRASVVNTVHVTSRPSEIEMGNMSAGGTTAGVPVGEAVPIRRVHGTN